MSLKTIQTFVPEVHSKGYAFGYDTDSGDEVFIPPRVIELHDIETPAAIDFYVVPNRAEDAERVPWRAVGVAAAASRSVPPAPTQPAGRFVAEDVIRYVQADKTHAHTVASIADECWPDATDAERSKISSALRDGHKRGEIARAYITAKGNAEKGSFCVYGANAVLLRDILMADDGED